MSIQSLRQENSLLANIELRDRRGRQRSRACSPLGLGKWKSCKIAWRTGQTFYLWVVSFPTDHMGSVGHLWKGDQTTNKMRVKHEKVPCYARSYPRAIPPVPNPGDNSFLTAYSLKRREFSQSPHGLSMAKLDSVQECFFLFDHSL